MSDFAFKMSSLDRKLAIGEMVSPADADYDPEAYDYPDPLENPEAFVQQYLQDYNSEKRSREEAGEDCSDLDHFHSCFVDFLNTCSDSEVGEDDLPGTREFISLLSSPKTNGISSFRMGGEKESALPAAVPVALAAGRFLPRLLPKAKSLLPMAKKGLMAAKGGLGSALKGLGLASLIPGGGDGGGDGGGSPMNLTDYNLSSVKNNNRYEMPIDHVLDNLMFEAATSPGPKKRNEDIETLRSQVIAALKAWADAGESENRAEWWVYFSYAHEASTIAELQTILTAVPAEYHNAVMTSPLPAGTAPTPGDSGLPEVTDPAEGSASVANPSPIPIDGAGTPPKMPEGQGLIPGALSTHDKLKIKPIFAATDESTFEDYAEEDRPILAKVAKFIESGIHEEEIVDTLSPSYGLEKTLWAFDQATKVASNSPLVDPAVSLLNVPWKTATFSKKDFIEVGNWIAKNHPETVSDRKEMGFQTDPLSLGKDYLEEEGEWEFKELLNFSKDIVDETFEQSGANEDTKINQQQDSNLITPSYEKNDTHRVADYTSTSVGTGIAPYSQGYNEAMGWNQAINQGVHMPSATGVPPNPVALTQAEKEQQEMQQLEQMFPNVPPEVAKKFLNYQSPTQEHPVDPSAVPSSGEKASPSATQLPSATFAKAASWKDINGNLLERGRLYKMTSPEYPVPDFVRVVNNGPDRLDVHITKSDVDLSLNEEKIRTSKFKFEPMEEEKTANFEKETYYIPGYHAIISVRNPETEKWNSEVSPNDRLGHIDVLWDHLLKKDKSLAGANDRLNRGSLYANHTARGLYNPKTKHLVHLSHPNFNDQAGNVDYSELDSNQREDLKNFWSEQMNEAGIPVSGYEVYGHEDSSPDVDFSELPWEAQQKAMRAMRDEQDPTRGHWLEDEPWQKGKTKSEIDYWNRAAKWKLARAKKEANLSTMQQRELIDERGSARNLDRLNLEGTHYPELANFEQTATLREEPPTVSMWSEQEDLDLFL